MKKLLELLKKLLGGSSSSSDSSSSSGFTLVELLIVIAILGILAAGLLLAIDPADKIKQANDQNVMNSVREYANRAEQYAIQSNNGTYLTNTSANLTTMKINLSSVPSGWTMDYLVDTTNNNFVVYGTVKSKKYTSNPYFMYSSQTGKSCFVASAPTSASACN